MKHIYWFPWHHGTSSDPKFRLIALQVGCKESDCLSVWVNVLEQASAAEDRGAVTNLDSKLIALTLGLEIKLVDEIVKAMQTVGLLDEGRVTDWEKMREFRYDPTNAKRQSRSRKKKREDVTLRNDTGQDRTEQDTTEHKKKGQETGPPF